MANCDQESIDKMRENLKQRESELKTHLDKLDDQFLLKCLRSRDFDVDKSTQVLINYFSFREKYPQFFEDPRTKPGVMQALKSNMITRCSVRNEKNGGEEISFTQANKWDSTFSAEELILATIVITEHSLLDEQYQLGGSRQLQV